jgi:hypothetical protein
MSRKHIKAIGFFILALLALFLVLGGRTWAALEQNRLNQAFIEALQYRLVDKSTTSKPNIRIGSRSVAIFVLFSTSAMAWIVSSYFHLVAIGGILGDRMFS